MSEDRKGLHVVPGRATAAAARPSAAICSRSATSTGRTSSGSSRPRTPSRSRRSATPRSCPTLRGRLVVNVFYESSTRTSSSFELAAKRLSADTLSIKEGGSSADEGRVAEGHGAHALGLRPRRDRDQAPADRRAAARRRRHRSARRERRRRQAPASDAGPARSLRDPRRARPARGRPRRDRRRRAPLARRAVADPGAPPRRGERRSLVGPPPLLPRELADVSYDIDAIATPTSSTCCGCSASGCRRAPTTSRRCASTAPAGASRPERLRSGQKVMHPGPMNRGVEIDPRVADSEAALVVDQVRAGLVVRMAVLYDLLTTGPVAVEASVGVA